LIAGKAMKATRPVFKVSKDESKLVSTVLVEFEWAQGRPVDTWALNSISLRNAALAAGVAESILEISTKSDTDLGKSLSPFSLMVGKHNLEALYHSSKVFENTGPFPDIKEMEGHESKSDPRLKSSGALTHFEWRGQQIELDQYPGFFNWIYHNALVVNKELARAALKYRGYTDICFNPDKGSACQAFAMAQFKSLAMKRLVEPRPMPYSEYRDLLEPYDRVVASPKMDMEYKGVTMGMDI
jgi:hypothetical protein